jgi:hypothetical protein
MAAMLIEKDKDSIMLLRIMVNVGTFTWGILIIEKFWEGYKDSN